MAARGEIYWVDWNPSRGSEQSGNRPALVVQNDTGNELSPTTIVVSLTTREMRKRYPFHVPVPEGVLPKHGTIMCEQIMTIDQSRLIGRRIALLDDSVMREVDEALKRSLGLR
ncbi:MAG: type II toxin-antitoxin system PemK/MazF family toxin [Actinomycetota bacterium]|nr:type II toxin-antitoxin system PemK/MazF family toxin [Actinomycetota bacterium]